MNNPFFVLQTTDADMEILGIIPNKESHPNAYDRLYDSVVKCLQHRYDAVVQKIDIPEDYLEHHKPIILKVSLGEIGHPFDDEFTLTMAWKF